MLEAEQEEAEMTPDAKDLAAAIKTAKEKCGRLVLTVLDALDEAELGVQRIRQENPRCTVADIEDIAAFILKASEAVEMAGVMLDLAAQKLEAKTDVGAPRQVCLTAADACQIDEWLSEASDRLQRSMKERERQGVPSDTLSDAAIDLVEYARERLLSLSGGTSKN